MPLTFTNTSDDNLVHLLTSSTAEPHDGLIDEILLRGQRLAPKLAAIFTAQDAFTRPRIDATLRAMSLYAELKPADALERLVALCAKAAGVETLRGAQGSILAGLGPESFPSFDAIARAPARPTTARTAALQAIAELGVRHASLQKAAARVLSKLAADMSSPRPIRDIAAFLARAFDPVSNAAPSPAADDWVLRQTKPFTLDDAVKAMGTEAASRLASHPQVAEHQGRFFTPRIAAAMPFVIRLLPAERTARTLIVGHRFLPFQPFDSSAPKRLRLASRVTVPEVRAAHVSPATIAAAYRFLPKAAARNPKAFEIGGTLSDRGEFVVRCENFDSADYAVIKSMPTVPAGALEAAFADVLATPPPGPVNAARQLLHVVARCWDPSLAIGPLGPILMTPADIYVRADDTRAAFHRRAPGDYLYDLESMASSGGGELRDLVWQGDTLAAVATVRTEWGIMRPSISFEADPVRSQCACYEGDMPCGHVRVLAAALLRQLRDPGSDFAKRLRADLAKPPWKRGLERIDAVLAGVGKADAREERLTWRVSVGDRLQYTPYVQKRTSTGKWSAGRAVAVHNVDAYKTWATAADLEFAARGTIASLVGHPAVFIDGPLPVPATVERAPLRVRLSRDGGLNMQLEAGGLTERMFSGESEIVFIQGSRIVLADATPEVIAVARQLLQTPKLPPEAEPEFIARIPAIERVLPVELPDDLAGDRVTADLRPRLRLTPRDTAGVAASMRITALGHEARPGEGSARFFGELDGKRVFVERALDDERRNATAIAESLGLPAPPWEWTVDSDDAALDLIVKLESRTDVLVEWPDGAIALTRPATAADLRVDISTEHDWFGLDGDITVDGSSVSLKLVLEAIRDGRRYVRVKGAKWLRLADLFRGRLRELADVAHGMQIGPTAAPIVKELAHEAGTLKACEAWSKLESRFEAAMAISPDPPASFSAELRDYQLEGYRWLRRLAAWGVGGCLADDMGLGKTIQALAVLVDRAAEGPALVVCPTSVASNWARECRRFAPTLNPVMYRETRDIRVKAGDVVIVSYGLVLRDAEELAKVAWGTAVFDEAQFLKNSQSKTAAAVRRIPAGWRLAMTGTPIENHLGELWSLFRAVSPGVFGSWERFRERFAAPIERDRDASRRVALSRVVRPFILRRTKSEVLAELPERTEIRLDAALSPEERALYDAERLSAVASLGKVEGEDARFKVLAALTRLRQVACHPRLVMPAWSGGSAKLDVFLETVEELREGRHRALVFSQFVKYLTLVREALDAKGVRYQYLDGSTPPKERDAAVDAFQRGEGDLFLISLKAGGTGLNLTAADYVIHLDPWWNPAVEDQATDRAHRIGQTRPVTVYRIVTTGTVEEKILALHGTKRELVAGVLEGTGAAAKLSVGELVELIRG